MLWSQSDLVKATAGDLIGDWRNDGIAGVSIDSRSIKSDELTICGRQGKTRWSQFY